MREWLRRSVALDLAKTLRGVWPLMADRKATLVAMVASGVLASIAESVGLTLVIMLVYVMISGGNGPFANASAVGLLGHTTDTLARMPIATAGIIVALVIAKGVLVTVFELLAHHVGLIATERARTRIFRVYLSAPYLQINGDNHAELIHHVTHEASSVASAVVNVANVAINLGAVAIYALYIAYISTILGGSFLVLGLIGLAAGSFWARTVAERGAALNQDQDRLFHRLLQAVTSLRTIRIVGSERFFLAGFDGASREITRTSIKLATADHVGRPVRDVGLLLTMGSFLYIAHRAATPLTHIITVVALLYRVLPHITAVEDIGRALLAELDPLRNAMRIIAADPGSSPAERRRFEGLNDRISLENIGFTYPGNDYPSLNDVSFAIIRGSVTTIAGGSGCGKTTLLNILTRLYPPDTGNVLVDGVPLDTIDRAAWTARLGFAGQDVELIDASLRENVRFGRDDVSDEDIAAALEIVEAEEFLARTHLDLNAPLGDRGLSLSGGQRQRVGLARAIAARPDILLLDEALNSVDMGMEDRILTRLREYLPEATFVIVTHRNNIDDADVSIRLDWGWVTEIATPAMALQATGETAGETLPSSA